MSWTIPYIKPQDFFLFPSQPPGSHTTSNILGEALEKTWTTAFSHTQYLTVKTKQLACFDIELCNIAYLREWIKLISLWCSLGFSGFLWGGCMHVQHWSTQLKSSAPAYRTARALSLRRDTMYTRGPKIYTKIFFNLVLHHSTALSGAL